MQNQAQVEGGQMRTLTLVVQQRLDPPLTVYRYLSSCGDLLKTLERSRMSIVKTEC